MKSRWTKWITDPGNIRVVALEGTHLMHELIMQQGLRGPAEQGYAEAVLGSLLVASAHKSNESINMNAQGSGVYRQALVDASPEGRVRGFTLDQDGNGSLLGVGVDFATSDTFGLGFEYARGFADLEDTNIFQAVVRYGF